MYLKSLEVHGFKSFANKIVFEFHNGITGIVGPNGSGKSNVGDAVRWVLGEQSAKQLRGSNMQDVIFSGTENRKPLGFAYVAITLDNSDHKLPIEYDEVKVARRVYRSGESEYLLNGTACRLKDVQELFYDTGIGKEGYSLIGQGQIDKILSGKPEERRELFDEAAGIVKFKRRKKAAQKNLENERANLVRINDILSELEKQVGPLERQAGTARTYLQKKEELKKNDIMLFLSEIERMKEQTHKLDENISIITEQLEETKEQAEKAKIEYLRVDEASTKADEDIEKIRESINQNMLYRERLEGEINVLKEQISAASNLASQFEDRKKSIDNQISEKKLMLNSRNNEYEQINKILIEMSEQKTQSDEILINLREKIDEKKQVIDKDKSTIIELINEKGSIESKQERYDAMTEQIQIRKAELSQKLLQVKSHEEQQNIKIEHYTKALREISEKISGLNEKLQKNEIDLKNIIDTRRKINEDISKSNETYHHDKSRLDSLVNMTERYDGYGNAIRKVMEQKENNRGIVGVVADIIKTEKKYETAIETALGGSIQNIVTDTEDTAKKMISYLKENRLGRATFLPLTSIQSKTGSIKKEVTGQPGVIGMANEIVTVKNAFIQLAEYLLGRTVVVDTMDNAVLLARKNKYTLRIVTLDGELLNPGGSMTGGAFKNNSNLLGRRREIEELRENVEKISSKISQLKERLEKENASRSEKEKNIAQLKQYLQEEFLNQNTAKLNLNQATSQKDNLKSDVEELSGENKEIDMQLKQINAQKKLIVSEAAAIDEKAHAIENRVDENQAELERLMQEESSLNEQISAGQISYASEEQKLTNISEHIRMIKSEISDLRKQEQSLEIQFENAGKENEEKTAEIDNRTKALEESQNNSAAFNEKLKQLNEYKQKLLSDNKNFFEKREELSKRENELDKESFRLKSQKEKLDESFTSLINYMWEEYELTYNAALEINKDEDEIDASAVRKNISRLKSEIKNLGNVNVNAIEEYKEISERYEFMKSQHEDLLTSEKTLIDIIAELDEGMRIQFNEKFAEIKLEFDKAYKELFGGGRGTIELDDDADVLEAGITINSQPPGKKLGNMMQLSGGEKALTAIALLFAIQNLKPSPFCLLDEIEAALDDSNVDRYARYLNKLTKNTQFIIITHRRGTMAAADRLYGITMQEKGVSTLVSVNLIEDDLDN